MWLALVPRARCEPRRGNVRQVATDAHRGRASPAKTVFIFVAHLPQYNNCAQPDQNSGDENYHNFFGPVYLPISLIGINRQTLFPNFYLLLTLTPPRQPEGPYPTKLSRQVRHY